MLCNTWMKGLDMKTVVRVETRGGLAKWVGGHNYPGLPKI
jgi:hypothetical protein